MVIASNSSEFDKPLSGLGPVPVDTTIRSPSGGKKPAARKWEDRREY